MRITSFHRALLASRAGVQEPEQSLPHFIEQDLDFPDWVEQMAPKPFAIISTTEDMFPFEGARGIAEEAGHFYGIYGVEDRIQWISGPGGHGNLGPISPQILGFFTKHPQGRRTGTGLHGDAPGTPRGLAVHAHREQVATSIGGETVYSLNRKRAASLMAPERVLEGNADLENLRAHLRQDIVTLAGVTAKPGGTPPMVDVKSAKASAVATESRRSCCIANPGIDLSGIVATPDSAGPKPVLLMLDSQAGAARLTATAATWIAWRPPGASSWCWNPAFATGDGRCPRVLPRDRSTCSPCARSW